MTHPFLESGVAGEENCRVMAIPAITGGLTPTPQHLETGLSLPNNQRQHCSSHAPKDVLPLPHAVCLARAGVRARRERERERERERKREKEREKEREKASEPDRER